MTSSVELSNLSRVTTNDRSIASSYKSTSELTATTSAVPGAGPSNTTAEDGVSADQVAGAVEESLPPEGGFGWVIVACCSVGIFFFSGTSYSYGVIQARLEHDDIGSPATLAFVGSMSSTTISIFAIPNSYLIRRFGARNVFIMGGIVMGLGYVLAGFAVKSIPGLFMTYGVVTGAGYSMIYLPCSVLPAQYFVRRRGLAYGIVQAAGGLGGGVMALAMNFLLETVGPAWCFRILGLITFACVVPAAWMTRERPGPKSKTAIQWSIFRDLRYTTIWIASALATFPLLVPPFFLPLYGQSIGLTSLEAAGLLAGFNLSSGVGRISFGHLSDKIGPINSLILAMLGNGLGMIMIWPLSSSNLGALILFVILGGMSFGAFFSLMAPTVASLIDPSIMTSGFGLLVTGWGAGYLFGAPIAGYLYEAYGGTQGGIEAYRPAMYYAGSLTLGAAVMVIGMKWRTTKSLKKRM